MATWPRVSWRRKIPYWQTWAMCCSACASWWCRPIMPARARKPAAVSPLRLTPALMSCWHWPTPVMPAGNISSPDSRRSQRRSPARAAGLPITAMTASASCNSAPAPRLPCVIPARTCLCRFRRAMAFSSSSRLPATRARRWWAVIRSAAASCATTTASASASPRPATP